MTGLLEDFIDRPGLRGELKITDRTISRYENQPDGLPSVLIGGRKLYRKSAVVEWIKRKERKPNQRRSA